MRLVFLDRDGVISRFPGKGKYVTDPKDLKVLAPALKGIRLLTRGGCRLAVVSNQGCVSRGLLSKKGLDVMTRRMLREIRAAGGRIHKVHYCLHQASDHCRCKKPKTFLFEKELKASRQDRTQVYVVGDSVEDILAGHAIGGRTILVLSGRSRKKDVKDFPLKPHFIKKDLHAAAQWILRNPS
jgi:D-glycero-D-manno-heptose 1,7-bisphosphate phosphatase